MALPWKVKPRAWSKLRLQRLMWQASQANPGLTMLSRRQRRKHEEEENRLYHAIDDNDLESLHSLIHNGIDVDMVFYGSNMLQKSPMHLCCGKGRLDCARALLEAGANLEHQDAWRMTPLIYSISTERSDMVKFLIDAGCDLDTHDKFGMTALHFAISNEDTECLQLLLEGGADVNCREERGKTPLRMAASTDGREKVIRCLLEAGASINMVDFVEQRTPLQAALHHTKEDTMKYTQIFLENGARVNTIDRLGMTPMTTLICRQMPEAKREYFLEIGKLLLRSGFDVNLALNDPKSHQFHGSTLKAAVEKGLNQYVEILLESGADPDQHDCREAPPILLAIHYNYIDIVKILIHANCNIHVRGKISHLDPNPPVTTFRCAIDEGNISIAELLVLTGYDLRNELYLLTNEDVPQSLVRNYEFWGWLVDNANTVRNLSELCRAQIRKLLKSDISVKIVSLPLPHKLKDYLLMTDLLAI